MKVKNNFLQNLINSISDDYILDLYEQRFIIPNGLKKPSHYIDNTINLYADYHKTLNPNFFNKVKEIFIDILKNGKIIELDNKIILKKLYDYTNQLLDFISEKSYPKKYFAFI